MGGGLACLAWVGWVVFLCGWHAIADGSEWHANMDDVLLLLLLILLKYYPEEQNTECLFLKQIEKIFQIDLNIDLKEEPDLRSRCWFTLFGPAMQGF